MADRTHNRPRPSWIAAALGTALGITIAGVGLFSTALAVHDDEGPFELDGNAADPAGGDEDWQGVFGLSNVQPGQTGTPTASSNARSRSSSRPRRISSCSGSVMISAAE